MTRIIAGSHRGRRLTVPAGSAVRPTADRAREALFSSLQTLVDIEGCRFLDLYAGSGALGLEALSRGADHATLVECDERALRVLRTNAERLALRPEIIARDVPAFLATPPLEPGRYDVAVLDPPYDTDIDGVLAALEPWLVAGGFVVAERRTRAPAPAWPPAVTALRSRVYGSVTLWYGSRS